MVICAADKVTKNWGGAPVLSELSLEIRERERIGLVGPNGCGKTTLLTLLAGADVPDAGAVHHRRGSRVSLLAQIPDFGPTRTAGDVLAEAFESLLAMKRRLTELEQDMADPALMEKAMKAYGPLLETFGAQGGYEMEAALSRVAEGLGITRLLDRPFGRLSGGERTKVGLGRILLLKPDLLLLDEPTNHLDLSSVEWLESYLQDYEGSVLIVSHDRYFLDRVATKIVDLEGGVAETYHGNYTYFVEEKERRLLAEFTAYQEQQKRIKKMEEAIKRLRMWAAQADNPKMFKRAAAMQKALDRIDRIDKPVLERVKMGLSLDLSDRSGKDVVVLEKVGVRFGERRLFSDVDLLVRFRETVAIVGENGCGKSTLLRMVAEGMPPTDGVVRVGSGVKIGYLAQHDLFPNEELTVLDAFRDAAAVEEGKARHLLAKFLFYGASVFRKVKNLSGGEKMRLRLAQLMHQDLNLLVLDEPTNHLDIDAREALEDTLASFGGTVVCVSHDRYFLNKLFPVTYWMEQGRLTRYEGRYDEAKRKRAELAVKAAAAAAVPGPSPVPAAPKKSASNGASAMPAKTSSASFERLERDIEAAERKLASLDEAMERELDAVRLQQLYAERSVLAAERELLYEKLERWM
ncbi:ABC-F family ATP-binding cassette domain-containing protein [Paenibacillus antri]|uniref:ABC-F family ATP-binding cassette domain-containing protein n=1 Tax=Paenibacillus antri TaxID=2582848 RepID=A0A5R9G4X7_9BACL|nr:ABC-F family ATP-binding cassette domain-containing protein [Paenibacillus antri]TLS49190.1 ABC-F family ATP-binding cassette domain-containing protein [Paenibacillus antri]